MAETTLAGALAELRVVRGETNRALAGLDPALLPGHAPWRGAEADVRFLLQRIVDDDLMRAVRLERALAAAGHVPTEAQRILAAAVDLRGRLAGSLIGLTAEQVDRAWGDGEWSVRRVLGHIIATDRRYQVQTLHAVERARAGGSGPLRPPDRALPDRLGLEESRGTMDDLCKRLAAARAEAVHVLSGLSAADLDAPTNWVAWDLDVRFRLFRFAEHDREHLVQLYKTYDAVGFVPTEPQRFLAEAGAVRGWLESLLVGVEDGSAAAGAAAPILGEAALEERAAVRALLAAVKALTAAGG